MPFSFQQAQTPSWSSRRGTLDWGPSSGGLSTTTTTTTTLSSNPREEEENGQFTTICTDNKKKKKKKKKSKKMRRRKRMEEKEQHTLLHCRHFLNAYNSTLGDSRQVFAVPCYTMRIGNLKLCKPKCELPEGLD
ncbi:uncharacterized protein LOC126989611 [Eriocheir sinensis]|uniref:uncharacterized protein LOC126989611 n=1 Tax=Eriocheir sinensis TaxID=95602 RepID=UPI0021C80F5C|nr:uncharacterized protein LOC126989611 [Eriocheir sinensis]